MVLCLYIVLSCNGFAGSKCIIDEDREQEKQVQGERWGMVVRAASQRESSYIA
jgi:hypothetical protein